jgi:hypothetical protein
MTMRAARRPYGRPGREDVGTRTRSFTSTAATRGVVNTTTHQAWALTPPPLSWSHIGLEVAGHAGQPPPASPESPSSMPTHHPYWPPVSAGESRTAKPRLWRTLSGPVGVGAWFCATRDELEPSRVNANKATEPAMPAIVAVPIKRRCLRCRVRASSITPLSGVCKVGGRSRVVAIVCPAPSEVALSYY